MAFQKLQKLQRCHRTRNNIIGNNAIKSYCWQYRHTFSADKLPPLHTVMTSFCTPILPKRCLGITSSLINEHEHVWSWHQLSYLQHEMCPLKVIALECPYRDSLPR